MVNSVDSSTISASSSSISPWNDNVERIDHFSRLPRELHVLIMTFFDLEDVKKAYFVNKYWNSLCVSENVWVSLYNKNFGSGNKFESDSERLFWAVKTNNIFVVDQLIKRDKNLLEAKDKRGGFSPLYRASQMGLLEIVKLLLKRTAKIECTDGDGSTPFYIACQENRIEVARYLISQGCNVECVFLGGFTPMYISAEMGHIGIVKLLCIQKANVNAVADRGATPLYIAAQNNHPEVVEYLIDCGADMEAQFNNIYKPIYIANSRGHTEVVEILKNRGASVEGLYPVYPSASDTTQ